MTTKLIKSASLHYRDAGSDKVYNVDLVEIQIGFQVNFEYGRRGSTLQTGTKTITPVDLNKAHKIFDKVVGEKLAKGYVNITSSLAPGAITTVPQNASGILPMLLNVLDAEEVDTYIDDDSYMMQEKMDGERRLIHRQRHKVDGINRKGLTVALPKVIEDAILNMPATNYINFMFDGEQIGDVLYVFDLLSFGQANARDLGAKGRQEEIAKLFTFNSPNVKLVPTAYSFSEKAKLYEKLKTEGREGVVFKHINGNYVAGRTSNALKFKFYETASFIVTALNDQRSVQIAVMADQAVIPVGNVTILPNFPVPAVGAIAEVKYLYAYQGGSVYQPIYLGERTDLAHEDCSIAQLKYKPNISLI